MAPLRQLLLDRKIDEAMIEDLEANLDVLLEIKEQIGKYEKGKPLPKPSISLSEEQQKKYDMIETWDQYEPDRFESNIKAVEDGISKAKKRLQKTKDALACC
ncbi:uncharacterized protein TRUGW13939_08589 [Talaromyces rugulosus]|uniref:Uncharacterized protein n=1 Tax=Talaromyces rugulosus TaxID=121627 RepID=A0A7H8R6S5_TALRU|nr:uncharacterized protein TRUGW13939_08589 [Talaromyces rugulosus]QKX61441.1 hypothetical protein TRUGW13939_08589 [Talaromyces rugulosus]